MTDRQLAFLEVVSEIARELSPPSCAALGDELREAVEPCGEERLAASVNSPVAKALARRLAAAWQRCPEVAGVMIAFALEAARVTSSQMRSEQDVEIVWTGPATDAVPVRRTDRVLVELIKGARERLLIVSFAAYKIEAVVAALQSALDRGVQVDLVLESRAESGGKLTHDGSAAVAGLEGDVNFWVWPASRRPEDAHGHKGSLHAKCAVADSRVVLVTSANLTEHALESNMELGIRIEGDVEPQKIDAHFRALMMRGVLQRVT